MPRSLKECNNCLQQFESHYSYCPYCGQKADDQLTLGVLFNNTLSNYFSVDARFFKSFIPLMFKPGYLAKQFVQGRRLLYLHPAQMYLFVSIVFFFLFSFISREQAETIDNGLKRNMERNYAYLDSLKQEKQDSIAHQEFSNTVQMHLADLNLNQREMQSMDSVLSENKRVSSSFFGMDFGQTEVDSLITAGVSDQEIYSHMGMKSDDGFLTKRAYRQALKFFKNKSGGSILQAFYDSVPLAMFILLPIFALLLKVFFYKKGRFSHHLVFSFYFFAFLFMVFSMLVIVDLIWPSFSGGIIFLVMLSTFFYLFLGVKRFYGQGYFLSFIKSNVISFVFLSLVIPFAAMIMGVMAILFY